MSTYCRGSVARCREVSRASRERVAEVSRGVARGREGPQGVARCRGVARYKVSRGVAEVSQRCRGGLAEVSQSVNVGSRWVNTSTSFEKPTRLGGKSACKRADRSSSSGSSSASNASSDGASSQGFYRGACPVALLQSTDQRSSRRRRLKKPSPPYAGRM